MSTGIAVPWAEAVCIAERISKAIEPHVVRIKAVGSLRRKRPYARDLEFVAEPRMIGVDLFGNQAPDVAPVRSALLQLGTWVKGGEKLMQITDVGGRPGFNCELHLVAASSWGSAIAIWTGPKELGHEAVTRMRERKLRHEDMRVMRGTEVIPTPTEEDFFAAAGLPCLPPPARDDFAHQLEQGRARVNAARRGRAFLP